MLRLQTESGILVRINIAFSGYWAWYFVAVLTEAKFVH